jgi:hypothetical protein
MQSGLVVLSNCHNSEITSPNMRNVKQQLFEEKVI